MSKNEQRRQKKLAKKRTRERQRKRGLADEKQRLASLAGKMTAASQGEIQHCYLGRSPDGTEVNGIVTATLVRSGPRGHLALANFLVDLWCLGAKNCEGGLVTPGVCREIIEDFRQQLNVLPAEPSVVRAIVEEGVRYAASLGLDPHPKYRKLTPLWGDIPAAELPWGVTTGRHGRPCYVVGPYDDIHKQSRIVRALRNSVGENHFDLITQDQQSGDEFSLRSLDTLEASEDWEEIEPTRPPDLIKNPLQ